MGLLKVQNSPGDGVFEDVKILRFKCGSTLTKETMDLVLSTYPNHSKPYLQVFRTYKESCDKRNKMPSNDYHCSATWGILKTMPNMGVNHHGCHRFHQINQHKLSTL